MYQFKDRYSQEQHHNTCSTMLVKNVHAHANVAASKYCKCRIALQALGTVLGKSGWDQELQPLMNADIRDLRDREDASQSEGRRTLSWIWATKQTNEAEMAKGMNKECILLSEEMCRVIQFHQWQAKEWEKHALAATKEGLRAYTWRQKHT
ncbi:hypothetical protein BDN71DRAFT_1430020 [Pleurotus eryngii]|uniref:Uncharacterized protein n=1 Tax=Pleurotus eryngii TaxID=5323 RepID=A0A9P6A051_PLEER|nr:hypothetical protein BDN71DRAFT_1430020 [Pleurotus eryngii]